MDAGQDHPDRRLPRATRVLRTRRPRVLVLLAILTLFGLAVGTDAAVLAHRVERVAVDLPPGPGTTWVVVGLDSRDHLPAGASAAAFGTAEQVPGSRADVVLVLHQDARGTTVTSVPRDLVVQAADGPARLALTWLDGPQATVDALCRLGIPTSHLVAVDLAGFAAVVDATGGLDVEVPSPVRDPAASLLLPEAGRQHIDGATALALVRSRHPEQLVDGTWVPAPVDPDGRASAAGAVVTALAASVRDAVVRPWRLQGLAWVTSGALTIDSATSVAELAGLARTEVGQVDVLPVADPLDGMLARFPTSETKAAAAAAGLSCDR